MTTLTPEQVLFLLTDRITTATFWEEAPGQAIGGYSSRAPVTWNHIKYETWRDGEQEPVDGRGEHVRGYYQVELTEMPHGWVVRWTHVNRGDWKQSPPGTLLDCCRQIVANDLWNALLSKPHPERKTL